MSFACLQGLNTGPPSRRVLGYFSRKIDSEMVAIWLLNELRDFVFVYIPDKKQRLI